MAKASEHTIFDAVRDASAGPVEPVRLKETDTFCFHCRPEVACWNVCCHGADVTLTPYDILRLTSRLELEAADFLARFTAPAIWGPAGLPVAKLRMEGIEGEGPCPFMVEAGCTVYQDRPATCRYYPLGFGSFKTKDADAVDDFFFLVKEGHCTGHAEAKTQSVAEFHHEQGLADYDRINRGWIDVLMKMASWKTMGGPGGEDVSQQTKQMFFLVSTDIDGFRRFVFETKFLESYDIDDEVIERLRHDDEALLQLGFDWLKSVMFRESTLSLRPDVLQESIARARDDMGAS
ncbi:MAG: YkgJ family cysteine cluster protein [Alphaproteobacteria bacterium]|nr:YkgJ family cysteine cluster protein [Alphaproteobacteria bacterium]